MRHIIECPLCKKPNETYLVTKKETVVIDGFPIIYQRKMYRCYECWGEFQTPEAINENLKTATVRRQTVPQVAE